ncbi:hypothetical protein SHIRM173S_13041 [Streptomyces hirsutus]
MRSASRSARAPASESSAGRGAVERGQRPGPVAAQAGPHRRRVAVEHQQRQQAVGREHPGQPATSGSGSRHVHEYAVAHHVEAARQEVHPGVAAVALDDRIRPRTALGLPGERRARGGDHLRVPLQTGHLVAGPRQAQCLCAAAHADVLHAPPPLGTRIRQLPRRPPAVVLRRPRTRPGGPRGPGTMLRDDGELTRPGTWGRSRRIAARASAPVARRAAHGCHRSHADRCTPEPLTPEPLTPEPLTPEPFGSEPFTAGPFTAGAALTTDPPPARAPYASATPYGERS